MRALIKLVRGAIGHYDHNPLAKARGLCDGSVGFTKTKREVERPFLVQEELNRIIEKTFLMPRMSQVRDIFIFCCYTGLAYADVEKLTREEITTGINGEKWIWTSRQKTESTTRIPLLSPALEILDRYKDDPQCLIKKRLLPVLSNQKMNTYLKEIADACNITKKNGFSYSTTYFRYDCDADKWCSD